MDGGNVGRPLEWRHTLEALDWNELSRLYEIAPLGHKRPADLQVVFSNSLFKCLVYADGRLVGAGRAVADGLDCSYICDVALHPDCQGTGLGKAIVAKLVEFSRGHRKIILYAVAGKEPFYKKLGFKRMRTAMAIFRNEQQALDGGLIDES